MLKIKSMISLRSFLIRVDHGLRGAETYAPPSNKNLHIPMCKSKFKTELNILYKKDKIKEDVWIKLFFCRVEMII